MIRDAHVRAERSVELHDRLAGVEGRALRRPQPVDLTFVERRCEQQAAGSDDAVELADPRPRQLVGHVGEDGDRVDDAEVVVGIRQRRSDLVAVRMNERQTGPQPLDEVRIVVGTVDLDGAVAVPVAQHAAATTAEVQQPSRILDRQTVRVARVGDDRRLVAARAEEHLRVGHHDDPHAQGCWRQIEPVVAELLIAPPARGRQDPLPRPPRAYRQPGPAHDRLQRQQQPAREPPRAALRRALQARAGVSGLRQRRVP